MNKGIGALIIGLLAILGGAAFAALLIKNKLSRKNEVEFDDFDSSVDDEEFEHFFSDDAEEEQPEENSCDISDEPDASEDAEKPEEEQL